MSGTCRDCGHLLFARYGDGDRVCAACRERRAEGFPPAIEPKPGEAWQPVLGRIGGAVFRDVCLAHLEEEPCPVCAAYIAAGR